MGHTPDARRVAWRTALRPESSGQGPRASTGGRKGREGRGREPKRKKREQRRVRKRKREGS